MSAAYALHKSSIATVYGPLESSRFGRVLGINILGDAKVCSFNCDYCPLGATEVRLNQLKDVGVLPTVQEILAAVQIGFRDNVDIDTIVVSGNGESTLHPDFPEIVKGIFDLRALWLSTKPIVIVTNGTTLDQRRVVEALNKFDERIVKIDAGSEKMFKQIASPLSRVTLQKILTGSRTLKPFIVQSTFHGGPLDNTVDLEDWIEVIAMLKPKAVHVKTAGASPLDDDSLHTIASKLERRIGLKALVLS